MKKRYWVLGVLLCVTVACRPLPPEKQATPVVVLTAPKATQASTPTFPPLETSTPRATNPVPPTLTPKPTSFAPRAVGGSALGLAITVPGTWVDVSAVLAEVAENEMPGSQPLFWADRKETANQLATAQDIGSGAFVLGFVSPAGTPTTDPAATLQLLVDNNAQLDTRGAAVQVLPIQANGVTGAYVDLSADLLNALPPAGEVPLRYRLLLFAQPSSNLPVYFQLGTAAENWDAYLPLFDDMMNTIVVYDALTGVVPSLEITPVFQGNLTSSALTNASITAATPDVWAFEAEVGRYATITVIPTDTSLDLTFALIAPSGQTVSTADFGYAGDTETLTDVRLPEAGRYVIVVKEFFGSPGPYQIGLLVTDDPQFGSGGPIEIGEVIMGELPAGGTQIWTFNGTAGQVVSVIFTPSVDDLDGVLAVYDPAGAVLISLDEGFSGDAEIISGLVLPTAGQYSIHISGFSGSGGAYTLSLAEGAEETQNFYDAGDLLYGDVKQENLLSNEAHAWFFEGYRDDQVRIVVTPLANTLDMHVWLLNADVDRLAEADAYYAGRAETIEATLPDDGQYIILVQEFMGRPGDYELMLEFRGNTAQIEAGVVSYGQAITGTLPAGQDHTWSFSGEAGDTVRLELIPAVDGDFVLLLRDPAGNLVQVVDEGRDGETEELPSYTLAAGGTWTIIVRESLGVAASYRLTLRLVQ